ncbi:MAG: tRNA (adenosine(37)-N6)-threonylcarbamoyltransferase complex transferase subunit TsaD [Rickettsiales bacterium]|nr:tRNA (adenosine(37)-N6)-threonylcarbamoyltransferase complex transferase subunit TsaD [Rickettsiales bacterium]
MANRKILCLGIESSCDETAAAVVDSDKNILSHIILSQIPEHQKFGGVVPELAARSHILAIDDVIQRALTDAKLKIADIDVVAATGGPGLIGGVLVGWMAARGLAQAAGKPLVAVNHLEGHALVPRLTNDVEFPYLMLLVTGGNTQILLARGVGDYEVLGQTIDDAAGEAFDKVAKMLGLPYPGGPEIDKLASKFPAKGGGVSASGGRGGSTFTLPRPLLGQKNCDFSFSGIKTSARTILNKIARPLTEDEMAEFCAEFQSAVADCIIDRLRNALSIMSSRCLTPGSRQIKTLVVAGGVAKNSMLREVLPALAAEYGLKFAAPRLDLCTDNGAMIAWAGIENYLAGRIAPPDFAPRPRWPLDEKFPANGGGVAGFARRGG